MSLRVESSAMVARKSRFLGRRRLERSDYFESHTSFANVRRVLSPHSFWKSAFSPALCFFNQKEEKKRKKKRKK